MPLNPRRPVVGVDLGHARIKVAVVERAATGFRVVRSGSAPTPPDTIRDGVVSDPAAVGDALRHLLKQEHIHAHSACVAAAGGAVFVRQVGYPKMAAAMLRESLRFEAGRHIPGSIEDSYVEGEIVGPADEATMSVLLVAAPKDLVASRLAACAHAGLQADEVDVEAFASYRATVEADPSRDLAGRTIALLDLGGSKTSVSIVRDGRFAMHRTLNGGGKGMTDALVAAFGLEPEAAEEGKTQIHVEALIHKGAEIEPPIKAIQPHLDDLVRELKRSLNFHQSQAGGIAGAGPTPGPTTPDAPDSAKVEAVWLMGGASRLGGLAAYLAAKLGLPTETVGAFDNVAMTHDGSHEDSGLDLTVACGLALRPFFRPAAVKAAPPRAASRRKAA